MAPFLGLPRGRAALSLCFCLLAAFSVHASGATAEDAPADSGAALGIAVGFDALRWQSDLELRAEFADYAAIGARWLRTDLNWSVIQAAGPHSYDWAPMDRIVALARRQGLQILLVVGSTPPWAWHRPERSSAPADVGDYANFVAAAVARYRPQGIRVWEIWNEPNLSGSWPPSPDPVVYARLLTAAYSAIKAVDPGATVIAGGLASVVKTDPLGSIDHYGAVDFLEVIYAEGAGDAFDALGFHPYSYPLMPSDPTGWNGWSIMTGPIRRLMQANGDAAKKIWITEYGAPTNVATSRVTEQRQAEMLAEAHWLAQGYPWAGPLFWYSYRDLGADTTDNEDWFGVVRSPGDRKPSYFRFRALAQPPG